MSCLRLKMQQDVQTHAQRHRSLCTSHVQLFGGWVAEESDVGSAPTTPDTDTSARESWYKWVMYTLLPPKRRAHFAKLSWHNAMLSEGIVVMVWCNLLDGEGHPQNKSRNLKMISSAWRAIIAELSLIAKHACYSLCCITSSALKNNATLMDSIVTCLCFIV